MQIFQHMSARTCWLKLTESLRNDICNLPKPNSLETAFLTSIKINITYFPLFSKKIRPFTYPRIYLQPFIDKKHGQAAILSSTIFAVISLLKHQVTKRFKKLTCHELTLTKNSLKTELYRKFLVWQKDCFALLWMQKMWLVFLSWQLVLMWSL